MLTRNYYLVLGCNVTESPSGVRDAFRELVKHYHPDRVGPGGTPFLQEIAQAYRVLSDFDRRNNYVLGLKHAGEFARGEPDLILPDTHPPSEVPLPAAARVLKHLKLSGASLEFVRERVLRNFARGGPPDQWARRPYRRANCSRARGSRPGGLALVSLPAYYPCPVCRGSGQDDGDPCLVCDETGAVEESKTVRVPIPPMAGDLDLFEVPLRGLGVHNYYLRLLVRSVSGLSSAWRRSSNQPH